MSERTCFRSMGCEIVVAGAGSAEAGAVRALFEQRDATFSRFRSDSELNQVNAAAGRPVVVSQLFAAAVETALWAASVTNGQVDPTLGAAVEAAGYDRDFEQLQRDPGPVQAGPPGNWGKIRLVERLFQAPTGVRLDLNGVVKAMAVDDAVSLLERPGFVSAGGDLAARGEVDVALPGGAAVRLIAGGLATSGCGRRQWVRGGRLQHHLIDPRAGRAASSPWEQVTVAGASCLAADVAAKAAFLLGEEGPAWLDEGALPGRFIGADGSVHANGSWLHSLAGVPACT